MHMACVLTCRLLRVVIMCTVAIWLRTSRSMSGLRVGTRSIIRQVMGRLVGRPVNSVTNVRMLLVEALTMITPCVFVLSLPATLFLTRPP